MTYALGAAFLALTMWSGTAIANKIAVGYMSGLTAGVLRSMLAGLIALAIAVGLRLPTPVSGRDRLLLIGSGLASFAVWPALISVGLERTTASHTAVIMALIPVFTVLIAQLTERRLPGAGWWLGAGAAFAATALLVASRGAPTAASSADGASVAGDLIVLAGTVVCATGYVAGGRLAAKIGTVATTFWGLAVAMLLLLPVFGLVVAETEWAEVPVQGWVAIAWLTLLSSLAGYALWFYALSRGGIARIGSLQLAMPVVTIVAAALILGEALTPRIALIAIVIVGGAWWTHRHVK